MALTVIDPDNVEHVFADQLQAFPDLVGETEWHQIRDDLYMKLYQLQQSENLDERELLAGELLDLIEPFKVAAATIRDDLQNYLKHQQLQQYLVSRLKHTIHSCGIDDQQIIDESLEAVLAIADIDYRIVDIDKPHEKAVEVSPGGRDGATSIKIQNLVWNKKATLRLLGEGVLTGFALSQQPHPFLVAASLFLLYREAMDAITVEFNERDASVYWGMLAFPKEADEKTVTVDDLTRKVNDERRRYNMTELDSRDIKQSLHELSDYGVVKKSSTSEEWVLVEPAVS